ncbi:hypothetical protein AB6Q13_19010 [Ralstonia solanacearum]|uniref:hypothetical protein n=1 Tax=Ralstonia solanacearum TaxID=305 RepID=UPI002305AC2E|nr:hypothetical protein [Ralstonia solanacearum]MDB0564651.1 hypothetical protein [Ralstonia solanacearum]MDB0577153.1 hypothetical protein [Ralstonia solanacearum]
MLIHAKPGDAGLFPLTGVQEVVMVDPNDKYTWQLPLVVDTARLRFRSFLEYRAWAGGQVSHQVNEFGATALARMGGLAGWW